MDKNIITLLEAEIPENHWKDLVKGFDDLAHSGRRPEPLLSVTIAQSKENPKWWCVIGIWKDVESFEEYRRNVNPMEGVKVFRKLGIEPKFSMLDVKYMNEFVLHEV